MNTVQMGFNLDKIWQNSFEILKTLLKFDKHPPTSPKNLPKMAPNFNHTVKKKHGFFPTSTHPSRQNSQRVSVHIVVVALQAVVATTKQEDADPSAGLSDFFGFRHERVIVEAVEESYRDCLRCLVHATQKKTVVAWCWGGVEVY